MSEQAIRPIEPRDDASIAAIIRAVMTSFGAVGPGFAIEDAEVDGMSAAYDRKGARYFVIEEDGRVMGGAGIAPLDGGASDTCELRKMYFVPEARGLGLGQRLLARCLDEARAQGYRRCYLETLTGMDAAQGLYVKMGFKPIPGPKGSTGHTGCDRFYERFL